MSGSDLTIIPLHPHLVNMVTPEKCLYNRYNKWAGLPSDRSAPFDKYCKDCEYRINEACVYTQHTVEIAKGNYIEDEKEWHYVQFCCANCGELIKLRDSISYIYDTLHTRPQYCEHCKTPHVCIRYENDTYTFAVPVKEKKL
jgi:hypothetical protein